MTENNKDFVNMATGGSANRFSDTRKNSKTRVEPMKATGEGRDEPKLPAFAQASPTARQVPVPEEVVSEEEEAKVIAANTQEVDPETEPDTEADEEETEEDTDREDA